VTPVAALVVSDWLVARPAARNAGLDALGFQGVPELIGVIITVAKHPSIVDPRLAMALRKERLQTGHLLIRQPVQVPHPSSPH